MARLTHDIGAVAAKGNTMARKIVQIASARTHDYDTVLIALASDGTLWQLSLAVGQQGQDGTWVQLPDLPEPKLSEDFSRDPLLG